VSDNSRSEEDSDDYDQLRRVELPLLHPKGHITMGHHPCGADLLEFPFSAKAFYIGTPPPTTSPTPLHLVKPPCKVERTEVIPWKNQLISRLWAKLQSILLAKNTGNKAKKREVFPQSLPLHMIEAARGSFALWPHGYTSCVSGKGGWSQAPQCGKSFKFNFLAVSSTVQSYA